MFKQLVLLAVVTALTAIIVWNIHVPGAFLAVSVLVLAAFALGTSFREDTHR